MARRRTSTAYLLVEGKNDKHVIKNLCTQHGFPAFDIEDPNEEGEASGIAELLVGITRRLREPHVRTIGIVVDADQNLPARWQALRDRLIAGGYASVPPIPPREGWISSELEMKRVGIWLMPNNQSAGILEDFVAGLIPPGDILKSRAESIVQQIEQDGHHRYPLAHHSKAVMHTWLAWQETPGQPMGLAITVQSLQHDTPLALAFVAWLRRLFTVAPTPEVA